MHCHLIVSRKDQTNKKKLSPLTNHKNTKKGTVIGGFDRENLFQQAELGFDKLFNYNRQLAETFEYCNTMKNSNMTNKLKMQERELKTLKQSFAGEKEKKTEDVKIGRYTYKQADLTERNIANKQDSNPTDFGLSSAFSIFPSATNVNSVDEYQPLKSKRKKKPKRGFRQ